MIDLKIKKPAQLEKIKPQVFCKNYIPVVNSSVMMLFSGGGVGKSFAAIRESLEFVKSTGKKVALWLTEDPEGENSDRYNRLVKQYGSTGREVFDANISFITASPVKLTKLSDGNAILTKEFWEIRLKLFDFSLIVLDPLLQFQGCDENSNTHAGVLMGALKDWASEENKIILLLHHASYNEKSKRLKARGAGEWVNGTRGAYEIARIKNEKGEAIESKNDYRMVYLIKDNGLSYHFRDPHTGANERELPVFPPWEKPDINIDQSTGKVRMSIADHNNAHNPKGFKPVLVEFDAIHNYVTEGNCYSAYQFAGGHRKNENNLGYSDVLCLDFDSGMTLVEAEKKFKGVKSLVVTTRSHRKNGNGDRFRVFIKLKTPLVIPASDHSDFMTALFNHIGSVDAATKDMARFFFSSPGDSLHWYSGASKLFDWEPLYLKIKKDKVFASINKKCKEQPSQRKKRNANANHNELPSDTMITDAKGTTRRFIDYKAVLSYGEKIPVQCITGSGHNKGKGPQHNPAGFVAKGENGNVRYWCSGGKCAHEETKYCQGGEDD